MTTFKNLSIKVLSYLPGIILALLIAGVAKFLEFIIPIHLIGASIFALFIGMIIHQIKKPNKLLNVGLKFTSKKILKLAIILLGASLSIGTILHVGKLSLIVMVFTLLTCFGGGFLCGKLLKLDWKLSNMISAGTGICGGSAIAAIAPVIEADDKDIAYAMSATFLFDMIMIIIFPILGRLMGMSDMAYGLWAGTAVNDTSSVVAAGYAFSEAAGDFATMVKLTRTLSIIPTVIVFAIINLSIKKKKMKLVQQVQTINVIKVEKDSLDNLPSNQESDKLNSIDDIQESVNFDNQFDIQEHMDLGNDNTILSDKVVNTKNKKINFLNLFPWFIVGFIALAIINSTGIIPISVSNALKEISKFLMIAALAAIGLNTSFSEMKKSGFRPMLHGFIISALVVIVALLVEYFMGIL